MSSKLQEKASSEAGSSARQRSSHRFWIILALAVLAVLLGKVIFDAQRKAASSDARAEAGDKQLAGIPEAKFTDVTTAAGLTFVHANGAYGEKLLPETMGGGVAFF